TAAFRASDELSRQRHIPADRISTVHYGIPLPNAAQNGRDPSLRAQLGFVPDRLGVVVVANLEARKGVGVLLQALARMRDQGVAPQAAVVGDGPMRKTLESEIRTSGL